MAKTKNEKKDSLFDYKDFDENEINEHDVSDNAKELEIEPPLDEKILLAEPMVDVTEADLTETEDDEDEILVSNTTPSLEDPAEIVDSETDDENIEEDGNSSNNSVIKCPHCLEEVLDMGNGICPLCGNPLKITKADIIRDDIDPLIMSDDYIEDTQDYESNKRKPSSTLNNQGIDVLLGDLPYQPDQFTTTAREEI